jgi:uncharacterized repeat protein (TIGR03803 family)
MKKSGENPGCDRLGRPSKLAWLTVFLCIAAASTSVQAQSYTVLHAFTAKGDGLHPVAGPILDTNSNLYGTTNEGGSFNFGSIFKIDSAGHESVLYSLWGGDGMYPQAPLVLSSSGTLYGTAVNGGTPEGGKCFHGCGSVFSLDSTGKETNLHAFSGGTDGRNPTAGLLLNTNSGALYGTTEFGGYAPCASDVGGCGTVFRLQDGKEKILHAFTGGNDGLYASGGIIRDKQGNFYGVTALGGPAGYGTVYRITPAGQETVLYSFTGGADGDSPSGTLVIDDEGNLYGETYGGGNLSDCENGCGVLFKVEQTGKETVLYTFTGAADGKYPQGGLVRDKHGNLYGTAMNGGSTNCSDGCGTVFRSDKSGITILHGFTGANDGAYPMGGVILDEAGDLYGTAYEGGDTSCSTNHLGCGVVFEIVP